MKSKTSHTPGPWSYMPHEKDYVEGSVFADGFLVATLEPAASCSQEQLNANARLIAAAPELLEALQKAVDLLEADINTDSISLADKQEAWERCMQAIAKAEGK